MVEIRREKVTKEIVLSELEGRHLMEFLGNFSKNSTLKALTTTDCFCPKDTDKHEIAQTIEDIFMCLMEELEREK